MHKQNLAASIFLTAFLVILQPIRADAKDKMITRQNQADQECSLTVDVEARVDAELGVDWISFTVSIPKNDKRLERLLAVAPVVWTGSNRN